MSILDEIDKDNLPNHIAIIMDGNGRWAKNKGLLRAVGHKNGVKSIQAIVKTSTEIGIKHITLYGFSTENWKRPKLEIDVIMKIIVNSLKNELKTFQENNIKLSYIGNIDLLPKSVKKKLLEIVNLTEKNSGTILVLALNYGSREEILMAAKNICTQVLEKNLAVEEITELIVADHLFTKNLPNVDLLIRTSGEYRVSNFLLWQIAYAELYFTNVLWPDFSETELLNAIISYQKRDRRFGKT